MTGLSADTAPIRRLRRTRSPDTYAASTGHQRGAPARGTIARSAGSIRLFRGKRRARDSGGGGRERIGVVPVEEITDPGDERIADYRALTDVELRTRWEPPHGLFIAEGELVLRRALRAGYRPRSFLVDAKRVEQLDDLDTGGAPVYAATPDVLQRATGFHVHRGVLASFHRRELPAPAAVLDTARRVVILEDVNNHTNLGAIFRAVAGLGVDAVLLSPSCADPLYRRSVRVSMGEVFAVPYARLAPWPDGLARVRAAGFSVLALTPAADAVPIQRLEAAHRIRPALLLGAEGAGLSGPALAASDVRVAIPMRRGVDSLNVAAAAAVAAWELGRDDDPA
jgi:tRNA G18 (ribose-2'-O)-methylase SpoU